MLGKKNKTIPTIKSTLSNPNLDADAALREVTTNNVPARFPLICAPAEVVQGSGAGEGLCDDDGSAAMGRNARDRQLLAVVIITDPSIFISYIIIFAVILITLYHQHHNCRHTTANLPSPTPPLPPHTKTKLATQR